MGGSVILDKRVGKYHFSIYWEGKRYRIFRNPNSQEPFESYKAAEKQLNIARGQVDEGTFKPAAWLPNSPLSFRVYAQEWLEDIDVSKKTLSGYRTAVKKYLTPFFKDKDIRKIRFKDIRKLKKSLPLAPKGVYNTIGVLKTMLRDAWQSEDIASVPPFPELKQDPQDELEYLEFEQQNKVIEAIDPRDRPIFYMMQEYGVRNQEARALQRDCLKDGLVIIRRKFAENELQDTTKTGDKGKRAFDITPFFKSVLEAMEPTLSPFVFTRRDGKFYTNKDLNRIWAAASKKTGIKCKLYNSFRHSLGCQLLDQGEDMDLVRETLGHTTQRMTRRYAQRKVARLSEALGRRRGAEVIHLDSKQTVIKKGQ